VFLAQFDGGREISSSHNMAEKPPKTEKRQKINVKIIKPQKHKISLLNKIFVSYLKN